MKPILIRNKLRTFTVWSLVSALLVSAAYADGPAADPAATGDSAPEPPRDKPPAVCSQPSLNVPLNTRLDVPGKFGMARAEFSYFIDNPKIAKVTSGGLIIPLSAGSAQLAVGSADPMIGCEVAVNVTASSAPKLAYAPKVQTRQVKAGGKTFTVQTVTLPKGTPVDIGLGGDKIGGVEALQKIAQRRKADFAINATFFEAYGGIPEPWGTLIADGEIAHMSSIGTTIGFTADGTAKMDTLRYKVEGSVGGSYKWPNNWYAYFFNRTPTEKGSSAILMTPKRGAKIGFAYGTAIVVSHGIIQKIAHNENVSIPTDGFVLVLTGAEQKLAERFEVGKTAEYRINFTNADKKQVDWSDVITAVGAGPRLLTNGKVTIDAKKEGFTEAKIISAAASRSGIGIKSDGGIILATTGGATIRQMADILKSLGAVQAMNLDGGASSGLYAKGKMLTTPGRLISNGLVFGMNLKYQR